MLPPLVSTCSLNVYLIAPCVFAGVVLAVPWMPLEGAQQEDTRVCDRTFVRRSRNLSCPSQEDGRVKRKAERARAAWNESPMHNAFRVARQILLGPETSGGCVRLNDTHTPPSLWRTD